EEACGLACLGGLCTRDVVLDVRVCLAPLIGELAGAAVDTACRDCSGHRPRARDLELLGVAVVHCPHESSPDGRAIAAAGGISEDALAPVEAEPVDRDQVGREAGEP